jgi:2-haloacid dehalogenase
VVAITNSVRSVAEDQLTNAGIAEYFDAVLSADDVRQLKPHPAPYLAVANSQGVPAGDVRLVAAHHWDIAGARAAGCRTAFIARPGMVPSPLAPPDLVVADIAELADHLLASVQENR